MRKPFAGLLGFALVALALAGSADARDRHRQYAALTPATGKADRIVVLKGERRLVLMDGDHVLRVYKIALGRYPTGAKTREGDGRTPEGNYTIDYRLNRGDSKFYRALHISYPNDRDRWEAARRGVRPGGKIMIHGLPKGWKASTLGHPRLDWTQGCIAVTNREIDEIWRMVDNGTQIEIHP